MLLYLEEISPESFNFDDFFLCGFCSINKNTRAKSVGTALIVIFLLRNSSAVYKC